MPMGARLPAWSCSKALINTDCLLHQSRQPKGAGIGRPARSGAGLPLEIAQPAGPRARIRAARERGRGRRLFRQPPEAGADRRLGEQAILALGKPTGLREGDRALCRQIRHRRGAAAAELVGLPDRPRAIEFGTTGHSACTTASNLCAKRRTRRGARRGFIREVHLSFILRCERGTCEPRRMNGQILQDLGRHPSRLGLRPSASG